MIYIAHRGNLDGPNPEKENHPSHIFTALSAGFFAEIDIWYINNKFILGHDKPDYEIESGWLYNDRYFVHCKNIEALYALRNNPLPNLFFHDQDDCTLTSQGWIWTFPRKLLLTESSIAVMPERVEDWDLSVAGGICTDYPVEFKKDLKFKLAAESEPLPNQ